ncbi:MAG: FAD:protein FMN transferase [Bryobacteraceae bacterium]
MGTLASITLYAEDANQAQRGFVKAFKRIAELDRILSDYKPDSQLSRVCDAQRPVHPDLFRVLVTAQRLAAETEGAFDITAGPVVRIWRAARVGKRLPDETAIAEALGRSGYRKLQMSKSDRVVRCLAPGMQLDAGGIAKGYAADEALAVLRAQGIASALVALGGDIAASDAPPGKPGWTVRAQDETLLLSHAAVSTSGDEFQFLEVDGIRYSHIVDPRTGMPLRGSRRFSVVADEAMTADSLATAVSVLGPKRIKEIERRYRVRVIVSGP